MSKIVTPTNKDISAIIQTVAVTFGGDIAKAAQSPELLALAVTKNAIHEISKPLEDGMNNVIQTKLAGAVDIEYTGERDTPQAIAPQNAVDKAASTQIT